MNKIDLNGCQYYNKGKCRIPHYERGIKFVSCNCDDWNCYYKQLQQSNQKLEDIKAYCKIHTDFCKNNNRTCEVCSFEPCEDIKILQIIEGM